MFGELRTQPSRLAPDCQMDAAVGQLVASGLASAATLLCASLLRTAAKCVTHMPMHICLTAKKWGSGSYCSTAPSLMYQSQCKACPCSRSLQLDLVMLENL